MSINISTHSALHAWQPACWMRVAGADAATFLQGQFTNDLNALSSNPAIYGLWLNVKGKVLADSFVLRAEARGEFWIGSYFSPAAVVRERLEAFVIADDVTLEDQTEAWRGLSVLGAPAAALLQERPTRSDGFTFAGRRDARVNAEYVYRDQAGEPAWAAAATRLDEADMRRLRIRAGIPAVPFDIGPGELPNEGGLEATAISYTKGCYLGQEVMARLKSMGQVRRRLLRVQATSGAAPRCPAPVFVGARQVGEVRSVAADADGGWMGLALVSLLQVRPDTRLALAADAEPAIALLDPP